MNHHRLDPYPIPKDKEPLYVNEPWLIDRSLYYQEDAGGEPYKAEDNIRIYVPMDLNGDTILRRLRYVISRYGESNEKNEMNFSADVEMLISQIEIYDRVWYLRNNPGEGKHSKEGIELVKKFVEMLESIPDGCAECFPFETIERLRMEYL